MSAHPIGAIGARLTVAFAVLIAATAISPAQSSDGPVRTAAARPADWSGFYFGGHAGYGFGRVTSTVPGADPLSLANRFGSIYAGVQGGYNVVLPSRLLLGIEGDMSFANFYATDQIAARLTGAGTLVTEEIDYVGRVRGRVGYAFDRWLVYGTGGFCLVAGSA